MEKMRRLEFIDSFRGIAASLVVFYHLVGALIYVPEGDISESIVEVFKIGFIGVDIFFVISGFVICMALARGSRSADGFKRFLIARVIRITPAYWAVILIVAAKMFLDSVFGDASVAFYDLERVVANLLYIQGFTGHGDLVGVFWTLCYEMQFYVCFGSFYFLFSRYGLWPQERIFNLFMFCGSVLSMFVFFVAQELVWNALMFSYFHFFALGFFAYLCLKKEAGCCYLYGLWVFYAVFLLIGDKHPARIVALAFGIFIYLYIKNGWSFKVLENRLFLQLGMVSYSLYLIHPVIGWKVTSILSHLYGSGGILGLSVPILAGFFVSYMFAFILWRLVEQKSIAWSREWGNSSVSSVVGKPVVH